MPALLLLHVAHWSLMPGWLPTILVVSYQYTPPGFLIALFRYGICNLGLVDVGSLLRKRWALLGQKSQIEAIKS